MRPTLASTATVHPLRRIRLWYAFIVVIAVVFIVRAFYLQVIRHDYYQKAALSGQLRQYEIPAKRGVISAYSGGEAVPLVLNEKKYTLFADPKYVKDSKKTASAIASIIGGKSVDYENQLKTPDTRYVVLAKKLDKAQKSKLDDESKNKSTAALWKGVGTREVEYRTYPNGQLASQVLGFVNDEGEGKYGVEQFLDKNLKGTPGQLKAITDASGVPLASNKDNVIIEPKAGGNVLLTIDISMQKQLEDILKTGLDNAKSTSGSALIMDVNSGAIKAMANYPTYNPAEFFKVNDASVFTNAVVSSPFEVGSIMKPLTFAAASNLGKLNKDSTYYDPGGFTVDGASIRNVEGENQSGTRSIRDILQLSLNTGATWMLMRMGNGEINKEARVAWNDYMVNHYQFGKKTGIEQGYEAEGSVPDPLNGYGLNIKYANTAFGQGVTVTLVQFAAAHAAVYNGGTYYKPYVVEKITDPNGKETVTKPVVVKSGIVKQQTSDDVVSLMRYVVERNYIGYKFPYKPRAEYIIGGKTGTAEIAKPEGGGYYQDRNNGTFVGFVGGNKPQYVIIIRVNEPHVNNYAGAGAAAPIFGSISYMLIDNSYVTPKS